MTMFASPEVDALEADSECSSNLPLEKESNTYRFVGGNPINRVDPLGLAATSTSTKPADPQPVHADLNNVLLSLMLDNIKAQMLAKHPGPEGYSVIDFKVALDRVRVYNRTPQRVSYVGIQGTYKTKAGTIEPFDISSRDYIDDGPKTIYAAHARVWVTVSWKYHCDSKPDIAMGPFKYSFYNPNHQLVRKDEAEAIAARMLEAYRKENPDFTILDTMIYANQTWRPPGTIQELMAWANQINDASADLKAHESETTPYGAYEDSGP